MDTFQSSLRCVFQVFLRSNITPHISMDFEVCIGVLLILTFYDGYFLVRVNIMLSDLNGEKRYPEGSDHSVSDNIVFCRYGCILVMVFAEHQMFRSSAKKEDFPGNLIFSLRLLMATRKSVTEMVEPWDTPFSCMKVEER